MNRAGLIEWLIRAAPVAMEWGLMLLPVAVYCLYLSFGVYRQGHPVVRSGRRNTLEVAAATSGLLLLGPPTWLISSMQRFGPWAYGISFTFYVGLLSWLLARELSLSRRTLVVFNARQAGLETLLAGLLQEPATSDAAATQEASRTLPPGWKLDYTAYWRCATLAASTAPPNELKGVQRRLQTESVDWAPAEGPAATTLALLGGVLLLFSCQTALVFSWYLASFDH